MHGRQNGSAWRVAAAVALGALFAAIAPSASAADATDMQACTGSAPQYTLDQQIAGCTARIAQNPNDAVAFYDRGNAYDDKGQYDAAIADYSRAIVLKPDFADAFTNRGRTHNAKGQHDDAIADYDRALALKPDDAEILYNRANAYDDNGQEDQAIADYTRAIALRPGFAYAFNNRGHSYSNKRQYDQAIADFQQALKFDPSLKNAVDNLRVAQDAKAKAAASVAPAISCIAKATTADSAHAANTGSAAMATIVLERMKTIKDYQDLSALYDNNRTNAVWTQSAEGIAVTDQLRSLRADAAATRVVASPEGRVLQYSVGGHIVTDSGVSAHDLERNKAYRETMATAIAVNIVSNPFTPTVQAALTACRAAGAAAFLATGLPTGAAAKAAPQIVSVPARRSPPVPPGLKVTCMPDGQSLTEIPNCPVIKYRGITTWAYSFIDNRVSFALVSYDAKNRIVRNVTKDGARYVWQITSDPASKTITVSGQSNDSITATWDEVGP